MKLECAASLVNHFAGEIHLVSFYPSIIGNPFTERGEKGYLSVAL